MQQLAPLFAVGLRPCSKSALCSGRGCINVGRSTGESLSENLARRWIEHIARLAPRAFSRLAVDEMVKRPAPESLQMLERALAIALRHRFGRRSLERGRVAHSVASFFRSSCRLFFRQAMSGGISWSSNERASGRDR